MPDQHVRRRPDGSVQGTWHFLASPCGLPCYAVRCLEDGRSFSAPIVEETGRIILGRSGGYLRRVNEREAFADRTSALVIRPGDEMRVAHPIGCGDTYTVVELSASGLARWTSDERWLAGPTWDGVVDDRVDLEHRGLDAASRRGMDEFEAAERTMRLVATVLDVSRERAGEDDLDRAVGRRPATEAAHRKLAYRAREVLVEEGFTLGLEEVAARVSCSPHHLSRVFHRVTGQSLTAYRHRLRLQAVLEAMTEGDRDLRTIAATYGFADQAHLNRVIRQRLGRSPSAVRAFLAGDAEPSTDVQRPPAVPPRA
ncbi:helix-turn-helix transcriptional regulator [Asanoa sp. WMMD1127]|uniref:helix-turn-helix domain-containing protein n=1 Tax=Asanoa sp. WMMD1127 TaxID=3016107 RepID=UPI002417C972|nr:helix-turn-helix transcriptional regulator [Asanoa sp. WMMD1127]MDG4821384.1 helix-turn-helix transcriptional regulator [Asanoa sp. WMMD1127]